MAQGSLKSKTISGVFWSAFQKFGAMAISFVANIVLARLLSPDDFGCIGMLLFAKFICILKLCRPFAFIGANSMLILLTQQWKLSRPSS